MYESHLDQEELRILRDKYGDFPVEHATIRVGEMFFESARTPVGKSRRAEILAVVVGPDGRVLIHTKRFYPPGIYRLISGGIRPGEAVESALEREIHEETGQAVVGRCLLGIITYDIVHGEEVLPFASYVYRADVAGSDVASSDDEEEISGFQWIPFAALAKVRDRLLQVPEDWQDWGRFRALGHEFVLRHRARCGL